MGLLMVQMGLALRSILGRALAVIATHPTGTALGLALVANGWQWHDRIAAEHLADRRIAGWRAEYAQERAAFATADNQSNALRTALAAQNASITGLAEQSLARQRRATASLAAARAGAKAKAAESASLIADSLRPAPAERPCPTSPAVLAESAAL